MFKAIQIYWNNFYIIYIKTSRGIDHLTKLFSFAGCHLLVKVLFLRLKSPFIQSIIVSNVQLVSLFGVFRSTTGFFKIYMETSPLPWKNCKCSPLLGLGNEGSLACYLLCHGESPLKMVISEETWHSHLLQSVWQRSCHYFFFNDLALL